MRFSVGVGGGNVGIAARAAADVEYWLLDYAGLGVLGALGGQAEIVGKSYSYGFVGPALMLRDSAAESHLFATAAFGWMNGGFTVSSDLWCEFDCGPIEYDIQGPGVVLNAGLTSRAGAVDLGGAVAVDLTPRPFEGSRWLNTVTLNVLVNIPL